MASKKVLTDLDIEGGVVVKDNIFQVVGPASGAGKILISDKDVGETEALSLNMTKSGTNSFIFDSQAASNLQLGSGNVPTLMTLNGDSGTVSTTGTLTVEGDVTVESDIKMYEDSSLIFDVDGDEFSYIKLDLASSNNIYSAAAEHHFINGDGGAYEKITAGSFTRDNGTSSQFLKADGSVDSNTYLTSSSTQSKYLRSDTADTTTGTLTAPKFFVSAVTAASQWAVQCRNNSSTADSGLYFNGGSSELYLRDSANTIGARIRSNNASYFNGGNVGVGTASPDAKVHINRAESSYAVNIGNTDARAGLKIINSTNNDSQLTFSQGGSGVQYIQASNQAGSSGKDININPYGGNVISAGTFTGTNFILSSDSRLKENVEEVDNKSINVDWKTFEMKNDEGQTRYGCIAQELEEEHPEFVRTDDEGMKSVAYVDLLIAKIAELEARLEKLEK